MQKKILKTPNQKRRRSAMPTTKIDPACAICGRNDAQICGCEAQALEIATQQAEEIKMSPIHKEIRAWVRAKAREYVLQVFQSLSEPRKTAHSMHLDQISAQCAYHYGGTPSPSMLARAVEEYRQGVSEDWRCSVQMYPEVLQYYFSLVKVTLPEDDSPSVTNPPLGVLEELRTMNRYREEAASAANSAGSASSVPHHHSHHRHPAAAATGASRGAGRGAPYPFFRPPGF